jgi:hypothetical protein
LAVTLVAMLALPAPAPAVEPGTLRGSVTTVDGVRVSDADLDLVSLDTGKLTRVRTDAAGSFEAQLDPASYKIELQREYVVVRGPRMVAVAAGNVAPAELVVANAAAAQPANEPGPTAGKPSRTGDIVALVAFSSALIGVGVYAATRGPEDRRPPSSSPRR